VTLQTLIVRYSAFAAIATIANLATQRLVLTAGTTSTHLAAAMAAGTLVGLIVKYALDKRWIFYDSTTGLRAHSQKFTLYTAMGLVTTAIFWGTEAAFWLIWKSDLMRELGAVLGLTIGYVVKYKLDRHFVFTNAKLMATA
jgi:putative flippase GtrA